MDYEFIYNPPQEVNQELLDDEITLALPDGVYKGSTAHYNEAGLCTRFVITVARELTEGELNAIAGN